MMDSSNQQPSTSDKSNSSVAVDIEASEEIDKIRPLSE